jgi:hypothetical protein
MANVLQDKLIKPITKAANEELELIKDAIDELKKKQNELANEFPKELKETTDKLNKLYQEGSIKTRQAVDVIMNDIRVNFNYIKVDAERRAKYLERVYTKERDAANTAIKADIRKYADNVALSYMSIEATYEETKKETQMMMEEKLTAFGEFAGEKINAAAQFIGTKTKEAINGALDYVASKISMISTNLSALTGMVKAGFAKLKNAIMHPIEFVKALPGKIIAGVGWALNKLKQGLIWTVKAAYSLVVGTIKYAMLGVLKLVKGLMWVVGKVFQGLFWVVKQAFAFMFKIVSKVFSFIVGVMWGAIKSIAKFVFTLVWQTLKTIAVTVVKVAWVIAKTLVQTIVTAIIAAFAPWIGILLLIGVGIYLLGRFFGWWGGDKNTKPGTPEKGGFFSGILDKMGGWWEDIGKYFWNDKGDGWIQKGIALLWNDKGDGWIQKGIALLWNDKGDGWIQKFFGITGDFFKWIWEKLESFWDWVMKGDKTSNPFEIQKEQQERIQKSLDTINDRQVELQKKSKVYTDELSKLNKLNKNGPLSVEQQKRKSDLERALKAISKEIQETNKQKAPLYEQLGKSKEEASAKAQKIAPHLITLMENKLISGDIKLGSNIGDMVGMVVKQAFSTNSDFSKYIDNFKSRVDQLKEGKQTLSQEEIDILKEKYNKIFKESKDLKQKEEAKQALEALNTYETAAQEISGRKEGLIGKIWEAISGWWKETASPWISKWIFGDATDPNSTSGMVGWISEKLKDLWKFIEPFIYGEGGGWLNPTGGILGSIFDIFFGKKSIDWNSPLGIVGYINLALENIKTVLLEAVNSVLAYSTKILESLSNLALMLINVPLIGSAAQTMYSFLQKSSSTLEDTRRQSIDSRISESKVSSSAISLARIQANLIDLNRGGTLSKDENLRKDSLEKELVVVMQKRQDEQKRGELLRDPESEKKAFSALNEVLKYGIFATMEQEPGFMRSTKGFDAVNNAILTRFSKYTDALAKNVKSEISWNGFRNAAYSEANAKAIISFVKSNEKDSIRILSNAKIYAPYFYPTDQDVVERMTDNALRLVNTIKNKNYDYDSIFNWDRQGTMSYISDAFRRGVTASSVWDVDPSTITKGFLGFADGGVIKPAPMGRMITVAEAGNPEIVLPLNAQGLKYIQEVSERIQHVESSGANGNNEGILKALQEINSKIEVQQHFNKPKFPAMNVSNSDKTELDMLKLISLGVISK